MKYLLIFTLIFSFYFTSCGSDENESDKIGIAGECVKTEDCKTKDLICLTDFKGGYCGIEDCTKNSDCPDSSICVTLDNKNYCFRECTDKAECNENRSEENQANCSSSFDLADKSETKTKKACLPPSK